jgi:hypothetical protein
MSSRLRRTTEQRARELLHRAENSRRLPGSNAEIVELWSWVSVLEREALADALETAPDGSDTEFAALKRCEAALLIAQTRRSAGWPRDWWREADPGKEPWR